LKRIAEFDGLRAVAVSLVVLIHATNVPIGGYIGVDIFFVLSGYLITALLVSEYKATAAISLSRFYGRRVLRIIPALWAMMTTVVALVVLSGGIVHWPATAAAAFFYMDIWRAVFHADDWLLGHTWSVAVEEQFYLLWPPVLLVALQWQPASAKWIAMLFVVASGAVHIFHIMAHAPSGRMYKNFDVRSVQLFVGCLLALWNVSPAVLTNASRFVWIPLIALLSAVWLANSDTAFIPGWYLAVAFGWILVAVKNGSMINMVLLHPAIVYLGRISYSLYIWHYPIIISLHQKGFVAPTWIAAGITISLITAVLSYELIEKPCIRLSQYRFLVKRGDEVLIAN
jgi:peptidoglycan/LPS O-acetylase OafA/YrhL